MTEPATPPTTMKYLYDFPGSFVSVQDARVFCEGFFAEYNHVHRHSGIPDQHSEDLFAGVHVEGF